jgi:uncharacterized membrane protein YeaQ/YmgE (transglycosylase-associated protein family)
MRPVPPTFSPTGMGGSREVRDLVEFVRPQLLDVGVPRFEFIGRVFNFAQTALCHRLHAWRPLARTEREDVMSGESLLVILVVGLIAGWLAGQIVQGTGFGLVGDLIIGIVGAFIGGWLLPQLGIHLGAGIVAAIINATIGALVLLLIIKLVRGGGGWGSRWGGGWGSRWGRRW